VGEVGDTRSDGDEGSEVLKTCRDGEEGASEGGSIQLKASSLYLPILALHVD
jgi:hypothetical protein